MVQESIYWSTLSQFWDLSGKMTNLCDFTFLGFLIFEFSVKTKFQEKCYTMSLNTPELPDPPQNFYIFTLNSEPSKSDPLEPSKKHTLLLSVNIQKFGSGSGISDVFSDIKGIISRNIFFTRN